MCQERATTMWIKLRYVKVNVILRALIVIAIIARVNANNEPNLLSYFSFLALTYAAVAMITSS